MFYLLTAKTIIMVSSKTVSELAGQYVAHKLFLKAVWQNVLRD